MARIKGWKRVKSYPFNKGQDIQWESVKGNLVTVWKLSKISGTINNWGCTIDYNKVTEKYFKTKAQALDYAVKYMKRHPRG